MSYIMREAMIDQDGAVWEKIGGAWSLYAAQELDALMKEQADAHAIELRAYEATVANLVEALRGVIRVADRDTVEFDAAKAAIMIEVGK